MADLATRISRRGFLALGAAGLAAGAAFGADEELPVTGIADAALEPFDKLMTTFIEENKIPGASLAVSRQGKLVYARGFGFADVEKHEAVQPASLFRIASVSKPITAVAILRLVEKGKFKLDDKVTDLMKLKPFDDGGKPDERWAKITVRQCLQHTGGWDRAKSYDPIGRAWIIAKALKIKPPVTPAHIVRYMMTQPLDFDPGERHAYSNVGYLVLGRIIEAVTGQTYEAHVKKEILAPLGIKTAQLGRATAKNRAKGEVAYYDAKKRTGPSLYPPKLEAQVPLVYGAMNLESFEAHGGWIASAIDIVEFASAFDDPKKAPLLSAASIAAMRARPDGLAGHDKDGKPTDAFYGCGWMVRPVGKTGKSNDWHSGYIPGSEALLVRRWDGLNWAVLFNTADSPAGKSLVGLIDGKIHAAADAVKTWPKGTEPDR